MISFSLLSKLLLYRWVPTVGYTDFFSQSVTSLHICLVWFIYHFWMCVSRVSKNSVSLEKVSNFKLIIKLSNQFNGFHVCIFLLNFNDPGNVAMSRFQAGWSRLLAWLVASYWQTKEAEHIHTGTNWHTLTKKDCKSFKNLVPLGNYEIHDAMSLHGTLVSVQKDFSRHRHLFPKLIRLSIFENSP